MIGFWEKEFNNQEFDLIIIGAGFTGLFSAWYFLKNNPNAKLLILDKAFPPMAASTRNAGFACFGSPTEILDDLKTESENAVLSRIEMRVKGLESLKSICNTNQIDYTAYGGYEVFRKHEADTYSIVADKLPYLNKLLSSIGKPETFEIANQKFKNSNFEKIIAINGEGQINPYKAWKSLYSKVSAFANTTFLAEIVINIESGTTSLIHCKSQSYKSAKVLLATNGFTQRLYPNINLKPARAQVLITKPIQGLELKGSYHMDRGFYYFRNVGNRVLLGGARHIDLANETSDQHELNNRIQRKLEDVLKQAILPNQTFEIEQRWSGIMGFGKKSEKDYILNEIEPNVYAAVRLGGMGVAISSALAKEAAKLIS